MLNQNFRTPEFTRATRDTIAVILLITNAFIWYYFASHFLKETVGALNIDYWTTALIWSAHYGGIIASAVIGYLLTRKFKDRTKFLTFWLALGVIASLTSMAVNITSASCVLFISLFLGISLGLGMPCCMGYFTEKIKIDRRGSIGGTVLLVSGVGMLLLGMVSDANPFRQTLILTVWRLFGLLCFMLLKTPNQLNQPVEAKKVLPYRSIINRQSFILYFVPWLMFSLLSFLSVPIQNKIVGQSTVDLLMLIESALGGVFAIVGGFFADVLGRKRIAIGGFALLGIGYSILGLFYDNLLSWYLYTVVDGIALGLLYVVFVVTIWGDFGPSSTSDKYYAIGVLPFFLSKYMEFIVGGDLVAHIQDSALFSFSAIFLFIAVLPLAYAPETLPDKVMKDRDLKTYVEKAKRKAFEDSKKPIKISAASKDEPVTVLVEPDAKTDNEDEEAERLAEKYY